MRSFSIAARVPWAPRLFALVSVLLLSGLAARADTIYTLHATSQSGQVFDGTFTIPTLPVPDSERYISFTGQITQRLPNGEILDTYVPDESDAEGSVRRFLWDGTHVNHRLYDTLFLYVDGTALSPNLTLCTAAHVCKCVPTDACPYPDPEDTVSFAAFCSSYDDGYYEPRCYGSDIQTFQTATLTGVSTAATPEPSSLLLSLTGALCLMVFGERKWRLR